MKTLRTEGFTLQGGILRDRDAHAVEFSLVTNSNNRVRQSEAALIQADLLKIGIRVSIVTLDFGSIIDRIARTSQYNACLLRITTSAVDPLEESNLWLSSGTSARVVAIAESGVYRLGITHGLTGSCAGVGIFPRTSPAGVL
jgi:peptide/nickel transport system substrate-binding protein